MKRLFFIAVALFTISTMVANVTIQTNFDGIVLCQSTREEIKELFASKGFVLTKDTANNIAGLEVYVETYSGTYQHEEMIFETIYLFYLDDTVNMISFEKKYDTTYIENANNFLEKIHSKYNELENCDSSAFALNLAKDEEGVKTWSRKDDQYMVITQQNDSLCSCTYIAFHNFIFVSLRHALESIKKYDLDYAEENKVYGVGGVKFGDSKASVKSVILSKSERIVSEDAHSITFGDTKIGGVTYDFATFYFSSNQLISVNLQSAFYSWRKEEALMKFKSIKDQYGRKYSNLTELKDEEDLKGYNCGAFIDGYDYLPILISFQKSLSKGGDIMYYVEVDYYLYRRESLYDDEI